MGSVITRSNLKKFILKQLEARRPHLKINRVSGIALDSYGIWLKAKIIADIDVHPSVGKTFNPERGL